MSTILYTVGPLNIRANFDGLFTVSGEVANETNDPNDEGNHIVDDRISGAFGDVIFDSEYAHFFAYAPTLDIAKAVAITAVATFLPGVSTLPKQVAPYIEAVVRVYVNLHDNDTGYNHLSVSVTPGDSTVPEQWVAGGMRHLADAITSNGTMYARLPATVEAD